MPGQLFHALLVHHAVVTRLAVIILSHASQTVKWVHRFTGEVFCIEISQL